LGFLTTHGSSVEEAYLVAPFSLIPNGVVVVGVVCEICSG
jgi:hypothetical protein